MADRYGNLTVETDGKNIEIANGRVCVRLVMRDGGYVREFYASPQKGKYQLVLSTIYKALIPSSEHRACSSPMIAGERNHLFGVCRESLRMVYSTANVICHDEHAVTVRLQGLVAGHSLACEITLEDSSNAVYVKVDDNIARGHSDPVLEYLMSSYAFLPGGRSVASLNELDYAWAPLQRPANDHVIGDCAFYSPAVIVQQGRCAAALVPDLDMLAQNRVLPAALDLDISNGLLFSPLLSYGFCGYEMTDDDRCCFHDITMSRRMRESRLSYGYYLYLDANAKKGSAHRQVARLIWEKFGSRLAHDRVDTEPEGRQIDYEPEPSARAALGLYKMGRENHDRRLIEQAHKMIDLVLDSPQEGGIFPTAYDSHLRQWRGCKFHIGDAYYSTSECSAQLYWLLKWHTQVRPDTRILTYCRRYADFLIDAKLRSGAVPVWFDRDKRPLSTLRSSVHTAMSALFFSELGKVTNLVKYERAFEHCARFVVNEIAVKSQFTDETCFDVHRNRSFECVDPHTGVAPQSLQALLWTAELCLKYYERTANRASLELALEIMDSACLLQGVRQGPWAPSRAAGLCASGNMRPACDAELSADFARCAMHCGAVTGDKEYFERGAVALKAALALHQVPDTVRARIAACAADINADYGSAYVHVQKKWAVGIAGREVKRAEYSRGAVMLEVSGRANGNGSNRVVFGGLHAESYKIFINGDCIICTEADMRRGISVPDKQTGVKKPADKQPVQAKLFF